MGSEMCIRDRSWNAAVEMSALASRSFAMKKMDTPMKPMRKMMTNRAIACLPRRTHGLVRFLAFLRTAVLLATLNYNYRLSARGSIVAYAGIACFVAAAMDGSLIECRLFASPM